MLALYWEDVGDVRRSEGGARVRFLQDFKLESLLFVAFFATLPLYSPNLVMFHDLLSGSEAFMPPFVNAMMVTAVAMGLGVALVSARRDAALFVRFPVVLASAVLYLVGFGLFFFTLGVEGFGSEALAIAAGIAVSLGVVPLCVAWGTYLSMLDLRQALLSFSLMIGVASLVELLLSGVAIQVGLVSFCLLLVLGVALPCWKAAHGSLARIANGEGGEDSELERFATEAASGLRGRGRLLSSVRGMASVLAMPFAGLLVFAFVMGVRKFLVFDLFYVEALGGIVAALVVLPLCLVKTERPLLSLIYQVLLPLFALVLVVLNSFPVGTVLQWLAATFSYVFFGVVGILALASLCAMAHAREFPPPLIYGLTAAGFALVSLCGIMCGTLPPFEDQQGGPILLVISTCYFAFLVGAPLLAAWRREGGEAGDLAQGTRIPDGAPVELRQRCERVAEERGLSPREAEILSYLGRGHGIAFVAGTLVISESTVRTHVKSIYRKLEVSSREELLQLIDGECNRVRVVSRE